MHITVTHQASTLDNRSRVVERIGAQRFPNTRMSYNALLHRGGEVHEGQPRGRKGAHTVNNKQVSGYPHDLNHYGHALSYVGMEADAFGEAEAESAARYFAALVISGESRATQIEPHRKFAWKACPGDRAMAWLPEINRRFKAYVQAGRLPGGNTPNPPKEESWLDMATKKDVEDAVRAALRDTSMITSVDGNNWSIRHTIERLWHAVHGNTRDIPGDVWRFGANSYISGNHNSMRHALLYTQEAANRLRQTTVVDRPNGGDSSYAWAIGQIWKTVAKIAEAQADERVLSKAEVQELVDAVGDAIPPELASDVADELGERISGGSES